MKKLILFLVLFTFQAKASSLWTSLDYSTFNQSSEKMEKENRGDSVGLRTYYSFKLDNYEIDAGLGFRQIKVDIKNKDGNKYYKTDNLFLTFSPKINLTEALSLGWENSISILNPIRISTTEEQTLYLGVGVSYKFNIMKQFNNKIAFSLQRGANLVKDSTMATFSLQFNYDK